MGKYVTKEQLTALVADMASKINIASGTQGVSGSYVPIGCIEAFMGVEAPPDFLVCDGSLHSIASYPQLADHFYEQFGASNHFGGNGTTTFAVPDLRGEFLRGTGTNSHENQGDGASVGVHQDGTFHMFSNSSVNIYGASSLGSQSLYEDKYTSIGSSRKTVSASSDSSPTDAYTSRPTNTSVLWCIKAIDEKFNPRGMVDYSTDEQDTGLKWIDGKTIYQKTITGAISQTSQPTLFHELGTDCTIISIEGYASTSNFDIPIGYAMDNYNCGILVFANTATTSTRENGSITYISSNFSGAQSMTVTVKYTKN